MGWFDLDNGIALCFQCHRVHGAHSLDVDEQIAFREWMKTWLKTRAVSYDVLKIRCSATGKIGDFEYSVLYSELKKEGAKYGDPNRAV